MGTPARQPQPAPAVPAPITKEVRHLVYRLEVVDTPDGKALAVVLPGEGEAHIYALDEESKQRLLDGLTGGITLASADQLPPAPE